MRLGDWTLGKRENLQEPNLFSAGVTMGYQGTTSGVGNWVNVMSDGREVKRRWSVGSTWVKGKEGTKAAASVLLQN